MKRAERDRRLKAAETKRDKATAEMEAAADKEAAARRVVNAAEREIEGWKAMPVDDDEPTPGSDEAIVADPDAVTVSQEIEGQTRVDDELTEDGPKLQSV